ncbi:YdcF family protein [Shewanella surugensis]|uniref:YdcF family protein n=1 Tax=Shewanella surugensis TaxID=212020 RepID=A0ABT0LCG5_9GAMM|nr:YdcF family protein [Shewanella surugensis]MCL1125037.1 YdcF family protein [Shewanella surugensis]
MSFILFAVLTLLMLVAYFIRWRGIFYSLLFITLALFLLVGTGIIPQYLLDKLQQDYRLKPEVQWQKNNAIILLGAGTQKIPYTHQIEPPFFAYGRLSETVIQYQLCQRSKQVCKVIVSGGDPMNNGLSEAEVYKATLTLSGVADNDIITEANSMNTWQNAKFTHRILEADHFDNLVLITSGFHLRRSELYFTHFGIHAIPIRADYMAAKISPLPLWYNFAITDFAIHEYIGIARYFVYNVMGWNNDPVKGNTH